jgi:Beta-propeller repeat
MGIKGVFQVVRRLGLLALLGLLGCHGSSSVTSVSVAAGKTLLSAGESTTLTASVLGSGDFTPTVTWTLDGGGPGLVSQGQSATYTLPATGVGPTVVIRATSTENTGVSGTVTIAVAVTAGVSVTAAPASLYGAQTATVTAVGTGVPGYVWTIVPSGVGTLSATAGSSVVYTAPSTVPSMQMVSVVATSSMSAAVFGSAAISLLPISVVVSAGGVLRVPSGQSLDLNGSVAGPPGIDASVTWSIVSGGGTLSSSSGSDVLYTAPPVTSETTVVIRAVPVGDPTEHTDFSLIIDHGWPQVVESTPDDPHNAPQDIGVGIAVDYTSSAVFVAGATTSGHFDLPANLGEQDGFVAKFDAYGNLLWVRQFGTEALDSVTGVAADTNGNVFVTGFTFGRSWTPGPAGPSDLGYAGFLIAYDGNGGFKWRSDIGPFSGQNASQCGAFGITVDLNNNIYAAGNCATQPLGVVLRCTAAGCDGPSGGLLTLVTPSTTPPLPLPFFTAIAVDTRGAYDLVGSTGGAIQGGSATPVGFVTQVQANTSATPVWVQMLGPTDASKFVALTAVAIDQANDVFVGGETDGTLSGQTSSGGKDAVLALFDGQGTPQWVVQFGTANDDFVSALVWNPFAAPQQIVATGTVSTPTMFGATTEAFLTFDDFSQDGVAPLVLFDGPDVTANGGGVTVADKLGDLFIGYTTGAQFSGPPPLGMHAGVQKLDAFGNPLSL